MKAPLPTNEVDRLEALYQCRILDTPPEEVFDCVTELATTICRTPIALISLVDEARQWFKSRVGLELTETPREVAFCAHAILQPDLFLVPDATRDERFANNPLVVNDPNIRFYAGMPLITAEGQAVGTLCVMDRAPRELEPWQAQALRALARQAMVQIELGQSYIKLSSALLELQQTEQALRKSKEKFSTAFRSSPGAMVITTLADGRYVDVNESFLRLTGYSRQEMMGKTSLELDIWPNPKDRYGFLDELQKTGGIREQEFPIRTKAGEIRLAQLSATEIEVAGEPCVLTTLQDITDRKRSEETIRESEQRFRAIFEGTQIGISICDKDAKEIMTNPALQKMLGCSAEELNHLETFNDLTHPDDRVADGARFKELREGKLDHYQQEKRYILRDGSLVNANVHFSLLRDSAGEPKYTLALCEDITEQKRLEEQLRQAQKMEAVGRLAGGIAHDFNNLLTVIQGHCELQRAQLRWEDPLRNTLEEIHTAADRAASLTRQLLAFSRQQVIQPRVLNLNELLAELRGMLGRLIGEDIALELNPVAELGSVRADPGLLQQVVLNLVVNARDAMPEGGKLLIETANAELDETCVRTHPQFTPGNYVMLAVSDTGIGMDAATQARIFEPFFTTKDLGKGTGLGLATVYGIVKQSGGFNCVYSEAGKGSTFKIYLPRVEGAAEALSTRAQKRDASRGTETILLVEDEDALRKLLSVYLSSLNYTVVSARDGNEALAICTAHGPEPQLLITDVVMPGISGRELGEQLLPRYPGMKVLYLSGYTDEAIIRHGILPSGVFFLQKPFQLASLSNKIRSILDGTAIPYKGSRADSSRVA